MKVAGQGASGGSTGGAFAVGLGILSSRVLGLVRQKVFSYFLGAGMAADAFNLAFRIPNLLQNLFGEGVLSASFIPVYARLRADGDDARRREVAGAVFGMLALGMAVLVAAGVLLAPVAVRVLTPGLAGDQRDLTILLVRILFPGAGLLVMSAWCLGVLNAHGRFLLSYASPVAWNLAMIVALLWWGPRAADAQLVVYVAWASVVGSALQVAVQWPGVRGALGEWRPGVRSRLPEVATVVRNFRPALIGRGVTQVAAFVDVLAASLLVEGSATILANAQAVYMLPVSLFGMSVSAAALPGLSSEGDADPESRTRLRSMLDDRLRQVAFLTIPSAVALMAFGPAIIGLLFEGGAFTARDAAWLRLALAAAGVGLVAATLGRLYSTSLFALQDARTPQRTAVTRVVIAAGTGLLAALVAVPRLGLDSRYGIVALLLASSAAAWVEWALLRRHVVARLGAGDPFLRRVTATWGLALLAAAMAWLFGRVIDGAVTSAIVRHVATLAAFGMAYLGAAYIAGAPEARRFAARLRR